MNIIIERDLQDAVNALQEIKKDNGKFESLPFMKGELKNQFHRCLFDFKTSGEIDAQDLAYFKFWVKYFGLSRDELRGIVFTKSRNERTGV